MAKKVTKTAVTVTTDNPPTLWQRIKNFFYRSESIFLSWLVGTMGLITTTVTGILGATDFSSILTMFQNGFSFTKSQLMVMGAGALGLGVIQYIARVRGTKEVNGKLLPKAS